MKRPGFCEEAVFFQLIFVFFSSVFIALVKLNAHFEVFFYVKVN